MYEYTGFPMNYVNPAVAISVEDLIKHTGPNGASSGYPISGDNIARVRAGVR